MRRGTKLGIAGALGLLALTVLIGTRWFASRPPRVVVVPANVPLAWATYRTGAGHVTHVDKAHIACSNCHDLAGEGFKDPGQAGCKTCHAKEVARGHGGKLGDTESCLTCHSFAPGSKTVRADTSCLGCHATAQAGSAPIEHHETVACATCHTPHAPTVAENCIPCHAERAPEHAAHPGSQGCADCHQPHASAKAAVASCAGCHEEARQTPAPGHATCEGCHTPHAFVATGRATCLSCHTNQPTLAPSVPQHAECTSCHAPHAANDQAAAIAACQGCHQDVVVKHDGADACVTCHEAHPRTNPTAIVLACTTCHRDIAPSDQAAHAGAGCDACHRPHDFTPPATAALCSACHESEITLTRTNPGHDRCVTCHGGDVHRETAAPACGSCHSIEQATAPPGHQVCVACHEPHSGAQRSTATCASCHASEEGGKHEHVEGGCATCHRPHGPSGVATPPACTTCHTLAKLPALHTIDAHSNCVNCHSSHGPTRVDRATCTTSCHVDRRAHQPEASVCDGCHTFQR